MRKELRLTIDVEILDRLEKEFCNKSRLVEALLRKHFNYTAEKAVSKDEEIDKI